MLLARELSKAHDRSSFVGWRWIIAVITCKPDCTSSEATSRTDNLSSFISSDIVLLVKDVCSFNNILQETTREMASTNDLSSLPRRKEGGKIVFKIEKTFATSAAREVKFREAIPKTITGDFLRKPCLALLLQNCYWAILRPQYKKTFSCLII